MYFMACSGSTVTGELARRACIEICEKLRPDAAKITSLAFYAQALITGDRGILGSSIENLKEESVACVNGCSMECAAKIVKALGLEPKCSIQLLEELKGVKKTGKLSDVKPEDVDVAVNYVIERSKL